MLGIGVGALATILGSVLAIGGMVFKAGQWKGEMEDQHEEQANAHRMVHRDVEKVLEHVDKEAHSSRSNCPTCSTD